MPSSRNGATYYNLGFGDYDADGNEISDTAISNNGEMRKVLATVVSRFFFEEKPHETVHIDGSDPIRRAYYHKLITDYSNLIQEFYVVRGCRDDNIEVFKRGKMYEFILINPKQIVFLVEEFYVMTIPKKSLQEKKLIKLLSSLNAEDIFPERNKKALENLKRAGLIKD